MTGIVAITMAGAGSRFAKAGFNRPKYEIEALGRPLFDWSMLSLAAYRGSGWSFWFAVREGCDADPFLRARCSALGIDIGRIVEVEGLTDGQATTALRLVEEAAQNQPLAIFNIDTFVTPGTLAPPNGAGCVGFVPCFPGPGDSWSFARTDASGRVVELREKQRISNDATVGLYWFDSVKRYRSAYRRHFATGGEEKGERYVAPLYNTLISDGGEVLIDRIALGEVGLLGTPEQLADFIAAPPEAARRLRFRP